MGGHKRQIFLVNPKFQIKFSLLICLLIFISSIFYPLTIYDVIQRLMTLAAETSPGVAKNASEYKTALIIALVLFQAGFILLSFILIILLTHRIAGPMQKLQNFLKAKREGSDHGKLFFRGGDYFPEIAEEFNKTFDKLQEEHIHDSVYIGEVCSYLKNIALVVPDDKRIVLEEIISKLGKIQNRFGDR